MRYFASLLLCVAWLATAPLADAQSSRTNGTTSSTATAQPAPERVTPTPDPAARSNQNGSSWTQQAPYRIPVYGANGTVDVGYYDMFLGEGNPNQIDPIVVAGQTPVNITDPTAAQLAGVDVLFVQNADNGAYGAEYLSRLGDIQAFVNGGGVLVMHDRFVDGAETVLPGCGACNIVRDFLDDANVDVLDPSTTVTNGPGGIVDDTTLDGGTSSTHGYADAGSLPGGAVIPLTRTLDSEAVTFSYPFGGGDVVYSTIPLDFYLPNGNPFADIYAPNVVAYGAELAQGGPSCDLKFLAADLTWDPATRRLCAVVTVRNNGATGQRATLKLDYNRNGGQPMGTRTLGSGNLPGNSQASRTVCLRVPGAAPMGNYNFTLRLCDAAGNDCGTYRETIMIPAPRVGGDVSGELFEVIAPADLSASATTTSDAPVAVAPNPFARQTTISYDVAAASDVRLAVYDVLGREVAVLVDARVEAGTHQAVFNASDLSAGTYVYRLVVGSEVRTGRMTLAH